MERKGNQRIRVGALALPLAGALFLVTILVRGLIVEPGVDPAAFARTAGSAGFRAGMLGITLIGVLMLFGILALYGHLANGPVDRPVLAGMILSLTGMGLVLPIFGVLTFAYPAAATVYGQGHEEALDVALRFSAGPFVPFAILSGLVYSIGALVLGVAIWRSRSLPRWSAIPYAVSAPLLAFPLGLVLEVTGAALLAIAGIALALSIWRQRADVTTAALVDDHMAPA